MRYNLVMKLRIKKMRANAILPQYQSAGAAGFDFHACIDEAVTLKPGDMIGFPTGVGIELGFPTGVGIELPDGYELQVRSRSGLAFRHRVSMLNGVGTIDADYRGEIQVLLRNYGENEFVVEPGMRIAQGVIAKVERVEWEESDDLSETKRSHGGFGSTGLK